MKKWFRYLTLTVFAITFAIGIGNAYAEAEYTMKFGLTSAVKEGWNYQHTVHAVLAEQIEARSGGRIKVELYPNSQLGGIEQMVIQTRQGLIQACNPNTGHFATLYPNIQVLDVPYLFVDRLVGWHMLEGETAQALKDDMAKTTGLRPFVFWENGGFRHYSNSKRPLRTAADLKGLKIRTMNNPLHMQIVKDLGASPTPIAWSELYTSLQTKVVDGQENAVPTFRVPKLEEVQKYMILDGHVYSINAYLINEKWLQSLPAELRNAIYQAGETASRVQASLSFLQESKDIEELREMGVDVYDPPVSVKKEFQELTQESAIKWLRSQKNINPKFIDMVLAEAAQTEKLLGFSK